MLIYVADDQEGPRGLLTTILEILGYKVVEFSNGQKLVEELEIARPVVVFTDIDMPILDGFGVIEASRKAEVPVLIATTGDPGHQEAIEAASVLFMPKPFDRKTVMQTLAEGLQRAGCLN